MISALGVIAAMLPIMTLPAAGPSSAPAPYGALPSAAQVRWQQMEFIGFIHFTTNTFTDKEWGFGDESPRVFNPTDFDAEQIVSSFAVAGMKQIVLVCKHHDGFCLWPSKFTDHSVEQSPWKGGKGDVVREISDACRRHKLKFGIYLSPWDRNRADYGSPSYVEYYRNQLRELITTYGPVSEVWHDGANGGDGYYGGAREARKIDPTSYYDWPTTWALIRKLDPNIVIFSDVGPDIRWVGTESGWAGDPCWSTITPVAEEAGRKPSPGIGIKDLWHGTRNGERWMPAETDFSIRPGWFYHASEDARVKTGPELVSHFFGSAGHGSVMLLNVPPDRRGRVHETDRASLEDLGERLKAIFATDLARGAAKRIGAARGGDKRFSPTSLTDGLADTYWATDDGDTTPSAVLEFAKPVTFSVVRLREYLPLGQRVDDWAIDTWDGSDWVELAKGTAIGSCRLVRAKPVTTTKVRLRITRSPVCPCISEMGLFLEP